MFGCVYFNSPRSTVDFHPLLHFNFQCLLSPLFLLNCQTSELSSVLTSISSRSLAPPCKQIFDSLLHLAFGFYLALVLLLASSPDCLNPSLCLISQVLAQLQLEVLREWGSEN